MSNDPDKWDRAAWYQHWRSLSIITQRLEVCVIEQHERIVKLEAAVAEMDAIIGELRAWQAEADERRRQWLAKQENGKQ